MNTRGGIFLLLLATLFIGSGCATWTAEPYGRYGMIEIPTAEAPAAAPEVATPAATSPVKRVAVKKPVRSRTVSSVKDMRCNCATKTQVVPTAGADKAPWFCFFCVTQTQTNK